MADETQAIREIERLGGFVRCDVADEAFRPAQSGDCVIGEQLTGRESRVHNLFAVHRRA
jgi:hypothetical protein